MAANEDEVRLRLTAETLGYRKAWADVRVQTARDLAAVRTSVTSNLNQARTSAAASLAGIRQSAAANLGQTRVAVAGQLAQIRVQTAQQLNAIRQTTGQSLTSLGSQFESAGRRMTVGLTLPLVALAGVAVKSARDLDAQVNVLRAFTGSTEAAEKRLAQLIATSRKTPGLTTALALDLDAQLRPLKVAEATIDKISPVIGRLNALKRIEDPQRFTENLVQLITTDFAKRDLRELVRASPLAGQIVAELFNVNSPTNAEAIRASAKRMGITTIDSFFTALADAASRNEGLSRVTESIGTRFDKLRDRVVISLRPLGLAIIDALTPAVDAVVPLIEGLGQAFASLPNAAKLTIVGIGGIVAAIGPAVFIVGSLLSTIGRIIPLLATLNAAGLLPTISNLRLLVQVMAGTASLAAGSAATTAVMVGGWIALAAALAVAGFAIYKYATAEQKAIDVDVKAAAERTKRISTLTAEIASLESLVGRAKLTTEEQEKLRKAYDALEGPAKGRIALVETEAEKLQVLIEARREALKLDVFAQQATAAAAVSNVTIALDKQAEAVRALAKARRDFDASQARARDLERTNQAQGGFGVTDAETELQRQAQASLKAADALKEISKAGATVETAVNVVRELSQQTGISVDALLTQAQAAGVSAKHIDDVRQAVRQLEGAQRDASKATGDGTGNIDAQTESLKQLKRALAEAEIAAKSRAEATKRAFDEGRISSQAATEAEIKNIESTTAAKLQEADAFLEAKRKELEAETVDSKKKTITEDIAKSELERKKIVAESGDEIANLQSSQRIKERDELGQHNEALISIARTGADAQIELLRAQVEKDESLRLANERKIVEIEKGVTEKEIEEVTRRRDLAVAGTEARLKLQDELNQKLAEKKKQGAEQQRRIDEAALANALRPVQRRAADVDVSDLGDQGLIERQRASLERSGRAVLPVLNGITRQVQNVTITSFENLEKAVKGIIDEGYARRIKVLQDEINVRRSFGQNVEQLEAQKARLEQERVNAREQGDRAIVEGGEKDLDVRERQIRQAERLTTLERTLASVRLSVREAVLKATRVFFGNEITLINQRYDIEAERLKLALDGQLDQLDEEERADIEAARQTLKNKEDFEKEKTRIEAYYRGLRRAAEDEARAQDEGNERERGKEIDLQNPASPRSVFGDDFSDALDEGLTQWQAFNVSLQGIFTELSAQAGNMRSIMVNAVSGIGNALAQSITNWILYGGSIGKAMKQAAAAVVAGIAVQAGIKAIWEVAEGLAALANPFTAWQAPLHFAAAKVYGLVAVGALAVGAGLRAAFGGSGSEGASTGAAGNLADNGTGSGGSSDAYESERMKRERQRAEDERYWRKEDRRGDTLRLDGPVIVNLDGRQVGHGILSVIRDGGEDLQGGFQKAIRGY